ncbi:CU044_5270 family protein [Micromonospora sp. C28SCA-DRY-2]|uniref:CU044_5270 family protein n=1 Tax=Micromonospora sp. C28SCA-DRY-2 TaxID=3059522 RepID=UPI0026755A77|nr:CU044_5270 family protein [Micromonospora sp. C28SCA-DRY-2]MDO3701605.1 CU044_5270 family protein [Micromonospora sp. C28SCA-DRY-2]
MDEMRLLQQFGEETGLPAAERLAPARSRLATAMAATVAGSSAPAASTVRPMPSRPRRTPRRLVLSGVAAVGLAAAIASALVLVPDRFGGSTPPAQADATQVLRNAAVAALRVPDVEPRPDQFVYIRSQEGSELRESWRSVDGTRDGLIVETAAAGRTEWVVPGCRNGRAVPVKGNTVVPGETEPCTPEPAYRADLPTDAAAMRAFLAKNASGDPGDANALGKDVLHYLSDSYLRPRARAALYEAAATMPDLQAVPSAKDAAGRPGIGVTWSSTNGPGEIVLVFHPETHTFLGVGGPAGGSAVLAVAIVDRVGQPA